MTRYTQMLFVCGLCIVMLMLFCISPTRFTDDTYIRMKPATDLCKSPLSDVPFPKILHQIWLQGEVSAEWAAMPPTCRAMYKDYEYHLWSDKDLEEFVAEHYPHLLTSYKNYPHPVQKTDCARYLLMHHFGGMYLDVDIACEKSFLEYMANSTKDTEMIVRRSFPYAIGTETIIAKPKAALLEYMVSNINNYAKLNYVLTYPTVLFSTGPTFFGVHYYNYPCTNQIDVLTKKYMSTYFRHSVKFSWRSWDGILIAGFYRHYGKFLCIAMICILSFVAFRWMKRRKSQNGADNDKSKIEFVNGVS